MEKVTLSNYGYKVAQIEINSNCNMACSFCPYPIKEDKTSKLPMQDIKNTLDHEEHGATPLLGINGVVMKCHGSSTVRGIKNSLIAAEKTVKENLIKDIATILSKHSNIFDNNTGISEAKPV